MTHACIFLGREEARYCERQSEVSDLKTQQFAVMLDSSYFECLIENLIHTMTKKVKSI